MIKCFEPWINAQTKIVIVGTMPSVKSLEKNMYYAHPQNNFWRFISDILNEGKDVQNRREFLLSHSIGLWDAISSCERKGSNDSNIRGQNYNDFHVYPQIKYYFFNGQKAFQFFQKHNADLLKTDNYFVLPSTSPANASMKKEEKHKRWHEAFKSALEID